MTDSNENNLVVRVKNLFQWYNLFEEPDLSYIPNSYYDVIKQLSSGDLATLGSDGGLKYNSQR